MGIDRETDKSPAIAVTPEMIEAGVYAFQWEPRVEDLEEAIERAYRAMREVERRAAHQDLQAKA